MAEWILTSLEGFYEDIPLAVKVGMAYTNAGEPANYAVLLATAERTLEGMDTAEQLCCVHVENTEGEDDK